MAKERHTQEAPSTSGVTLAILVVGIILVAALIVWAMTRTVEPETSTVAETTAAATTAGAPVATPSADPAAASTSPLTPTLTPTLPGATPAGQAPQGDAAEVARIAAEDLRAKMTRNEVTILDVRDGAAFATEHIPGAISTPFASLEAQIDTLPKGKPFVTYCT